MSDPTQLRERAHPYGNPRNHIDEALIVGWERGYNDALAEVAAEVEAMRSEAENRIRNRRDFYVVNEQFAALLSVLRPSEGSGE